MTIERLKQKVCKYQIFIAENKHLKDKAFLTFVKEVNRIGMMIEMFESCGECMSFNLNEKSQMLDEMYNNIFDGIESGL
ncbi:MAG: hypothetical protein IJY90_00465 [Clostridia bacterium]|nr:hypothetical protein [Clostridia bacterium]